MFKHLWSILLVTLFAVVIWIFAESETLRSREISVDLVFEATPDRERAVELVDPTGDPGEQRVTVVAMMEGSNVAIEDAERRLRRSVRIGAVDAGMPAVPGTHQIDVGALLRGEEELEDVGVSIRSVEPSTLTVRIVPLTTRELPVRVALARGDVDGSTEISPPRVRVRFPADRAKDVPEGAAAVAFVEEGAIDRLIAGRRERVSGVRVRPPEPLEGARHVSIDPPVADVALMLRNRTASLTIASVPVHIQIAPSEQSKWDIALDVKDQFISDVTVSGPSELIRQVQDKALPVVAILQLSYTELEAGNLTSKEVVFSTLPSPLRFEAPSKSVRFTITRRAGP